MRLTRFRELVRRSLGEGGSPLWWVQEGLDGRRRVDKFSGQVDMGAYETIYEGTIYRLGL